MLVIICAICCSCSSVAASIATLEVASLVLAMTLLIVAALPEAIALLTSTIREMMASLSDWVSILVVELGLFTEVVDDVELAFVIGVLGADEGGAEF
jgi:hypothetical protein